MAEYGILQNDVVVRVNVWTWGRWYTAKHRYIARTKVGETCISTTFLGVNYGTVDDKPTWFETLCLCGICKGTIQRYSTLEEATLGHERMVAFVKEHQMPEEKLSSTTSFVTRE